MTVTSLPTSDPFAQIKLDLDVISTAKPEYQDRFAVDNGTLTVTAGSLFQGAIRSVWNLTYGGYNRNDVTAYLEGVVSRCSQFNASPHLYNLSLEELIDYQHKLRMAAKKMKLLTQNAYSNSGAIEESIQNIYNKFLGETEAIDAIFKKYANQGLSIPPEPLDYDESVPSRLVDWRIPRSASVSDVIALAKSAEKQYGWFESRDFARVMHFYAMWFLNGSYDQENRSAHLVKQTHASAFQLFAHHFNSEFAINWGPLINYDVISSDPDELIQLTREKYINLPFITTFDPLCLGSTAKELIKEWIAGSHHGYVTFNEFFDYLRNNDWRLLWVEQPEHFSSEKALASINRVDFSNWIRYFSGKTLEERKHYFLESSKLPVKRIEMNETHITWPLLLQVINAIKSNPRCTDFCHPNAGTFEMLDEQMMRQGFVTDRKCSYIRRSEHGQ